MASGPAQLDLPLPPPEPPKRQLVLPEVAVDQHQLPHLRWEVPPYRGRGRPPSIPRLVVVGDNARRPVRGVRFRRIIGAEYALASLALVHQEDGAVFWLARRTINVRKIAKKTGNIPPGASALHSSDPNSEGGTP